jgi:hypothetical protein
MEQKVIITDSSYDVNDWLAKGWTVVSVTPQIVSASSSNSQYGKFCFVIQKIDK